MRLGDRWLGSRGNKGWRKGSSSSRVSVVLILLAALVLGTCAWISLVFSSRSNCWHAIQEWQVSPVSFPWEPPDTQENRGLNPPPVRIWPRRNINVSNDLSLRHIVFGIAGSAQLWPNRKEFVRLWWRPQDMRGFVWLEEPVKHEQTDSLPQVLVSEDISKFRYTNPNGHPSGIRIARIVHETFKLGLPDVRWFVMGDDDTVFSADNLLRVLKKYDYNELYYIGNPSESHSSNTYFSHLMAFGGGGIAISYPLAKAISKMLDGCLDRYPSLFGSDDRLHACITELGVPLTREPGFHQFDVHGNTFGLLATHPIAPFVSMHHLEELDPIFPALSKLDGLRLLTNAMRTEPSSFLQRSLCYDRNKRLTFTVSSGYVVQVYPSIFLPRDLERPEITFKAWNKKDGGREFDMDTRKALKSRCSRPFRFFLKDMHVKTGDVVMSTYKRDNSVDETKRRSFCFSNAFPHEDVQQILVESKPMTDHWFLVPRRQCCKVTGLKDQVLVMSVNPCQVGRDRSG
eukprot:c23787_g1_i1 orf=147-1688(+)